MFLSRFSISATMLHPEAQTTDFAHMYSIFLISEDFLEKMLTIMASREKNVLDKNTVEINIIF